MDAEDDVGTAVMVRGVAAAPAGPGVGGVAPAALELLPRPDLDPFERLALAFLAEYSPNSARAYRSDLQAWATWTLTVAGVHPLEARRHHVAAWVRHLTQHPAERTGRPLATSSVARRLACLSKFYDYGLEVGVLTHSPVPHVRRPKVSDDSTSVALSRDELGRLLDAAIAHSPRLSALVHLLAFNGLRIAEALNADVDDLVHDRGHRALRITRKGGKLGRVAIAPVTSRALDLYLTDRTSGPIFLNRDADARLSYASAYEQIRRLVKSAGLPGAAAIHPHSFRHTFATEALDAGAALQDVQDALGHADPRTTRRYDRSRNRLDKDPTYALAAALGRS